MSQGTFNNRKRQSDIIESRDVDIVRLNKLACKASGGRPGLHVRTWTGGSHDYAIVTTPLNALRVSQRQHSHFNGRNKQIFEKPIQC